MAVTTTTIAIGKWANRANLNFVPCNSRVNGKFYGAFGLELTNAMAVHERRPYRIDENGTTVYITYDDDTNGDVVIYRLQEA